MANSPTRRAYVWRVDYRNILHQRGEEERATLSNTLRPWMYRVPCYC